MMSNADCPDCGRGSTEGHGHDRIINEIVAVYPRYRDELRDAITQTKAIRAEEAEVLRKHATRDLEELLRRQFRPFLWVVTEHGARQFWTAVTVRQIKVLWMEEGFENLPEPEQMAAVRLQVREYYVSTKAIRGSETYWLTGLCRPSTPACFWMWTAKRLMK